MRHGVAGDATSYLSLYHLHHCRERAQWPFASKSNNKHRNGTKISKNNTRYELKHDELAPPPPHPKTHTHTKQQEQHMGTRTFIGNTSTSLHPAQVLYTTLTKIEKHQTKTHT